MLRVYQSKRRYLAWMLVFVLAAALAMPVNSYAQSKGWEEIAGPSGGAANYCAMTTDSAGNLYIVTESGGSGPGIPIDYKVMKQSGNSWIDMTGNGVFDSPRDIAVDSHGDVYLVDLNHIMYRSSYDNGAWSWTAVATSGIYNLMGVEIDRDNDDLYLACGPWIDSYGRLWKASYQADTADYDWDDLTGGEEMKYPEDVVLDSHKDIIVLDPDGDKLHKLSGSTWAELPITAKVDLAACFAIDSADKIYIGEWQNDARKICQVTIDGDIDDASLTWGDDIVITGASDLYTAKIALDSSGTMYFINTYQLFAYSTTYEITFDSNLSGATNPAPASKFVLAGKTMGTLPTAPTHADYTLVSWNTEADGSGTTFDQDTIISQDRTVYGKWARHYQVSFIEDAAEPEYATNINVISGSSIGAAMPEDPANLNKNFAGWNTNADGTGDLITAATIVNAPLTAYAQWTQKPYYNINIDPALSGGAIEANLTTAQEGQSIDLTVAPDPGKQLKLGSLKYHDGSDVKIELQNWGFSFTMPDHDITVSAIFNSAAEWSDVDWQDSYGPIQILDDGNGTLYAWNVVDDDEPVIWKYFGGVWTDITWDWPADASEWIGGAALDRDGTLYVLDSDSNEIKRYDGTGWTTVTAVTVPSYYYSPENLTIDGQGNFYVTNTYEIDQYNGTTWSAVDGSDGFLSFTDIAADGNGNLFLLDDTDGQIWRYDGGSWESIADNLDIYYYGSFCSDTDGNLYFQDGQKLMTWRNGVVKEIKTQGEFINLDDIFVSSTGAIYIVDLNADQCRVAEGIAEVSFDKNFTGAVNNIESYLVILGGSAGALPEPVQTGYAFSGWNTKADGTGSDYTGTTPVTGDITLHAKWAAKAKDDGGGGGGGGGQGPVASGLKIRQDGNGNVTIEITSTAPKDAKTAEVTFPKESMIALKGAKTTSMLVKTPVATILFDDRALDTIAKEAGSEIKITASRVSADSLSDEAKSLIGDHPVYSFAVTSGDKVISQFGGDVEVSVPYTPKADEDPKAIVIYYINAQGTPEPVKDCVYDEKTGMITFTTKHFSQYAVGYHAVSFSDVKANAWYADAVTFLAARGITTGTNDGTFRPDGTLTRGQFLVMTMRAYGISPSKTAAANNFADAGNTYYTDYLAEAKRLDLTDGIGNNLFAPEKAITRQEMFTLLYHTLKQIGKLPSGDSGTKLTAYADADQMAPWASDAVTMLVESGTITGNNGQLQLKDTTTRAQMTQVLYHLLSKQQD